VFTTQAYSRDLRKTVLWKAIAASIAAASTVFTTALLFVFLVGPTILVFTSHIHTTYFIFLHDVFLLKHLFVLSVPGAVLVACTAPI